MSPGKIYRSLWWSWYSWWSPLFVRSTSWSGCPLRLWASPAPSCSPRRKWSSRRPRSRTQSGLTSGGWRSWSPRRRHHRFSSGCKWMPELHFIYLWLCMEFQRRKKLPENYNNLTFRLTADMPLTFWVPFHWRPSFASKALLTCDMSIAHLFVTSLLVSHGGIIRVSCQEREGGINCIISWAFSSFPKRDNSPLFRRHRHCSEIVFNLSVCFFVCPESRFAHSLQFPSFLLLSYLK